MTIKNYKNLVPIVLIFLMVLASYKLIANAQSKEKEYLSYLEIAREKEKEGILTDSLDNYEKAITMRPSLELSVQTGEMIEKLGNFKQRIKWGEQIVKDYPDDYQGYEYLITAYLEQKKYADCFEVYDTACKKEVLSEKIQEMIRQIEYEYEFEYYVYDEIGVFAGGYCPVRKDGFWGYVNEKGILKMKCKYLEAGAFAGGLAYVKNKDGEFYFINTDSEKKLAVDNTLNAEVTGILNEGRYPVKIENEYFYCDEEGKLVLGPYAKVSSFNFGKAAVLLENGWTFIDTAGNILTENTYLNVLLDGKGIAFRNGRAFVETEEGVRMIDENFLPVGEEIYEAAVPFYESTYAAVAKGGKWGFIDNMGNVCIPYAYDEADSFSNGYAAIRDEEKWGYVNADGQIAIEPVFEGAAPFTAKGCAFVKRGEQWATLKLIKDNW